MHGVQSFKTKNLVLLTVLIYIFIRLVTEYDLCTFSMVLLSLRDSFFTKPAELCTLTDLKSHSDVNTAVSYRVATVLIVLLMEGHSGSESS